MTAPRSCRAIAVLLVVEDDPQYARLIVDLAHDVGLKVLKAARGSEALALARKFTPMAISLDVFLPDMLGWAVLSQLKQDPQHAPYPGSDRHAWTRIGGTVWRAALSLSQTSRDDGWPAQVDRAADGVCAPAPQSACSWSRTTRPNGSPSPSCSGHDDIEVVTAEEGGEALALLREQPADCVVLDLKLPDMIGLRTA